MGFLEKVYENALKIEMGLRGLNVETQKQFDVYYKGNQIYTDVGLIFLEKAI